MRCGTRRESGRTTKQCITNQKKEREESIMMNNAQRTKCEIFSRSMGFIRPVSNFNIGKYSEFSERKTFTESNCMSTGQRHSDLLKKAA